MSWRVTCSAKLAMSASDEGALQALEDCLEFDAEPLHALDVYFGGDDDIEPDLSDFSA